MMNNEHTDLDELRSEGPDMRRKRLLFRSWHRGTQEGDLVLGSFAESFLAGFDSTRLDRFEALLECADADLFDWTTADSARPPQHDHDVMRLLRRFCARPSRAPKHHG